MIDKKLQVIINQLELTPEEFSIKIGVGKSSIYKILRGDTKKITRTLAEKINSAFPQYTIKELLSYNYSTLSDTKTNEPGSVYNGSLFKLVYETILYHDDLMKIEQYKNHIDNIVNIKLSKSGVK